MDSENYQGSNISQCENDLSFFGRKVFNIMLQHYRAGVSGEFTPGKNISQLYKNNVSRYETISKKRSVGNNTESGSNLNLPNNKSNYKNPGNEVENSESLITFSDESCAVFSGVVNKTIPKTIEHLKSAHDNTISNNTRFDITSHSDKVNDCNFTPHFPELEKQLSHEYLELGKLVAWEDMVDSELFKVDDKFDNLDKAPIKKTTENKVYGNNNTIIELTTNKLNESNKIISDNRNRVDLGMKKVKKVVNTIEKKSETNLVKRKYTKAVKNWLNNVVPTNSVDGTDLQADTTNSNDENNTIENPDNLQTSPKFVEVKDTCKKMVQTHLKKYMVDSEMFNVDDKFYNLHKALIKKNTENKVFGNDITIIELTSQEITPTESNKILTGNSNRVDLRTKKVKKMVKTNEKKIKTNLLKRKYTKAVKNWLHNVDPSHSVEGIDLEADTTNSNDQNNIYENPDENLQTSSKFVEVKHTCKKMVQTQLKNDNGAMKFYKPNFFSNLNKTFGKESCTAVERSKVVTNKRKFTAPMKSQNLP